MLTGRLGGGAGTAHDYECNGSSSSTFDLACVVTSPSRAEGEKASIASVYSGQKKHSASDSVRTQSRRRGRSADALAFAIVCISPNCAFYLAPRRFICPARVQGPTVGLEYFRVARMYAGAGGESAVRLCPVDLNFYRLNFRGGRARPAIVVARTAGSALREECIRRLLGFADLRCLLRIVSAQ